MGDTAIRSVKGSEREGTEEGLREAETGRYLTASRDRADPREAKGGKEGGQRRSGVLM